MEQAYRRDAENLLNMRTCAAGPVRILQSISRPVTVYGEQVRVALVSETAKVFRSSRQSCGCDCHSNCGAEADDSNRGSK